MVALGLTAACVPLVLAVAGQARPIPAVLAAILIAGLTLVLAWGLNPPAPAAPDAPRAHSGHQPPYATMLEHITDPLLLIAAGARDDLGDRRYVFANAAARDILRLQRPEGLLTTALRAPEVLAAVEDALFAGGPTHAVYQTRGAQERFWRVTVSPVTGPDARPKIGSLALLTLTDETEIRRSERSRADFLANASHELRTPLASLSGFIETLRGHARHDDDAREKFLGIMQIQADRMRRLIDDLMSLSRIELSEHIPPSGAVDLSLAVTDVLDALAPLAAERRVAFQHDLPAIGEAVAVGDRDQILQVIQNLAENALKYTPTGTSVSLEVATDLSVIAADLTRAPGMAHLSLLTPDHDSTRRYIAVRVQDAGPGIARTNLPRLTERFYRVEGQKGRDRPGTGLGLAIVKHIVNRHRGALTVDSAEGVGSTFTVYFPMRDAARSPERP